MWALKIRFEQLDGPWIGTEQAGEPEWVCRDEVLQLRPPSILRHSPRARLAFGSRALTAAASWWYGP